MPNHPFQHIALSLSGGGYRAAAFHLGSMSYLNQVQWQQQPLLAQLAVISTISGGTITGMKYALCLAERKSFEQFYAELYHYLKEDKLLGNALACLNDEKQWVDSQKQRNLINAFTKVYHRDLLEEKTFKVLLDLPSGQFPEMVFNSTDLEHQLAFRFQKTTDGLIGNRKANLPAEAARDLRLGDIVASSSCFPGGFEPMLFPQDFQDGTDGTLAGAWSHKQPLRLMDGGIIDNQGIESVVLFEDRKDAQGPFIGSWFISDVTQKEVMEDEPLEEGSFWLNFSFQTYNIVAGLLLVSAVLLLWKYDEKWISMLATALFLLGGLWLGVSYWLVSKVVALLKKTVSKHASAIRNLNLLRRVQLKYVVAQVYTRLVSVGRLPDVFMKRIRDQGFENLFSNKKWNYRIKTNLLYDLLDPKVSLGTSLRRQVEKANQMGTTLWFSEEAPGEGPPMLDALIQTGRATMCFNLIEYINDIKKRGTATAEQMQDLEMVQKQCLQDWNAMNQ